MARRLTITFLWGLVTLLLSTLVFSGVIFFTVERFAALTVKDLYDSTRAQSEQIGYALGLVASEGGGSRDMANLSSVMKRMVDRSLHSNDRLTLQELYFLGSDGKILAHNDISKVARDSGVKYEGEIYNEARKLGSRDPVLYSSLEETARPSDPLDGWIYSFLAYTHKDLVSSRYMVAVAVYPADAFISRGTLHLVFKNNYSTVLPVRYRQQLKRVFLASVGAVSMMSFFTMVLLFFALGRPRTHRAGPGVSPTSSASNQEFLPLEIEFPEEDELHSPLPDGVLSFSGKNESREREAESGSKTLSEENTSLHSSSRLNSVELPENTQVLDAIPLSTGSEGRG